MSAKTMNPAVAAGALVLAAMLGSASASANLIVNGSFERREEWPLLMI
jgi:hypothetical protein